VRLEVASAFFSQIIGKGAQTKVLILVLVIISWRFCKRFTFFMYSSAYVHDSLLNGPFRRPVEYIDLVGKPAALSLPANSPD